MVVTSRYLPSGEMRTDAMMPGLPTGVTLPVARSTVASWEVA